MNNTDIVLFRHEEFGEIRTLNIDGIPWFVGKDVAVSLGYTNPAKALRDHVILFFQVFFDIFIFYFA